MKYLFFYSLSDKFERLDIDRHKAPEKRIRTCNYEIISRNDRWNH